MRSSHELVMDMGRALLPKTPALLWAKNSEHLNRCATAVSLTLDLDGGDRINANEIVEIWRDEFEYLLEDCPDLVHGTPEGERLAAEYDAIAARPERPQPENEDAWIDCRLDDQAERGWQ